MYVNKAKRLTAYVFALASMVTLTACGGGGGGGGGSPAPQPNLPPPQQMSFTVNLDSIDVRRASNGETVSVDTAGVSQSLTFED